MGDILQGLNDAQREAVVSYNVPSLIIAGAGSGKTRVLTTRIAYMIQQGVRAHEILALTFTRKAAEEMRSRIETMVGRDSRYISMGTFHSVFARMLREHSEKLGYPREFTIYETDDSKSVIKNIIKDKGLNEDFYKVGTVFSRISRAKNNLITPGAYISNPVYTSEDRQCRMPALGEIYVEYCRRCKQNGAMDFDDLLLQVNILLRDYPAVLEEFRSRFRYILVDEYQDTNYAQYIIVRRLSQIHQNICVVGDDAQSIYSFRGAKIENILSFQKDYPSARVFKLEQNYRSTQTIVDAANSVIRHNNNKLDKRCFSASDYGEQIRIFRAYTDREEGEIVVGDLRDRIRRSGDNWRDVAILYRTNAQSAVLENSLLRRGIPYRIYKGNSFYNHKEIKDMLGYIRMIINPRDDEAFRRIVNTPARGIGDTTVSKIGAIAQTRGCSMWAASAELVAAPEHDTTERAIVRKIKDFVSLIEELSLSRSTMGLYEFGLAVANRSGILPSYRMQKTSENESAIENIEELLNSMRDEEERCNAEIRAGERDENDRLSVEEWLQGVMLLTDMDSGDATDDDKVTLMTIHSAKGLEYKYVYITGCEEGLFPSSLSFESPQDIEEERRLFYVALTRAKSLATLSFAEMRYQWGNMRFTEPSRFLTEIDSKYISADFELQSPAKQREENTSKGESAIDRLRRAYDVRFQQGSQQQNKPKSQPKPQLRLTVSQTISPLNMHRVSPAPSAGASVQQSGDYRVGDRVEHPRFGRGTIVAIERFTSDSRLEVQFDATGEKKRLIASFAKLRKL